MDALARYKETIAKWRERRAAGDEASEESLGYVLDEIWWEMTPAQHDEANRWARDGLEG